MAKLNWSVQLVEISRNDFWYKKLDQISIGAYESYFKLTVYMHISGDSQSLISVVKARLGAEDLLIDSVNY